MVYVLILILSISYYSIIILVTENIMKTEMRTIEEYKVRNKEYRAEKRMALAQKIAARTTNGQMNTIQGITNEIYNIAKQIKLIKASYYYPDAKKEKVSRQIIELQNRVYELQNYLVRMAEAALGMYD